ncbi:MAG: diadenylate cyclase [Candidatus Syntrophoarchaeum sp.]|nr:diadenylate cyclase [Candidatus Syntrophoarchaeum sp.]
MVDKAIMKGNADDVKSEVVSEILKIAKRIAQKRKGALFVIINEGDAEGSYDPLFPQLRTDDPITEPGMGTVLEKLAELDGAVLLSPDGKLIAYGSRITKSSTLPGHGTRHAAAKGISQIKEGVTSVLISEESGWIKVFQDGDIVLETDAVDVSPGIMRKVARFLANRDTALLVSAGIAGAAVGGIPTLVLAGGMYLIVRTAFTSITSTLKG